MIHIFRKENLNNPTFLLLHGTGGDEKDLLPLAHMINPEYNVLSVRGEVKENGMNRFFKRLSEGVFDEVDLINRTKLLKEFITTSASEYGFDPKKVIALGYSNGANIAASILFHYSDVFSKAILFHPMVPIRILPPNLENTSVFIGAGKNDPICPAEESIELEKRLIDANAKVTLHWESSGHRLVENEVNAAKLWLNENA
jgi:phospholipase/carboxylesterase